MTVISCLATEIHGRCKLPPGYVLVKVPYDAAFAEDEASSGDLHDSWWKRKYHNVSKAVTDAVKPRQLTDSVTIASSHSALKALVALVQALFAIATLYNAYGHQIDRFGYAACGLTVVPYALMSLINLCANLACPEYSKMYLVSNQALEQLQRQYTPSRLEYTQDKVVEQTSTHQDEESTNYRSLNGVEAHQIAEDQQSDQAQEARRSREHLDQDQVQDQTGQRQEAHDDSEDEDQDQIWSNQTQEAYNGSEDGNETSIDQARTACNDDEDQEFEVSGTVGTLSLESDRSIQQALDHTFRDATNDDVFDPRKVEMNFSIQFALYVALVFWSTVGMTIGIIGGLSGFHKRSSTVAHRVWTMTWLTLGLHIRMAEYCLTVVYSTGLFLDLTWYYMPAWSMIGVGIVATLSVIPAIGGFVVVGQMINSYGVCRVV